MRARLGPDPARLLRAEGALRLQLTKALQRSRDAAKRAPKPAAAKAAAAEEVEEISTAGAQEMTDAEIRQQISELNLKTAGARRDYAALQQRLLRARRALAYRAAGSRVATLALREAWATCLSQTHSRARSPSEVAKC